MHSMVLTVSRSGVGGVSLYVLAQQSTHCLCLLLWTQIRVDVMVYLRDRIRQTDESDHSDVQQYEPNQNSSHNDYKEVR